jgi:hypothetical protein
MRNKIISLVGLASIIGSIYMALKMPEDYKENRNAQVRIEESYVIEPQKLEPLYVEREDKNKPNYDAQTNKSETIESIVEENREEIITTTEEDKNGNKFLNEYLFDHDNNIYWNRLEGGPIRGDVKTYTTHFKDRPTTKVHEISKEEWDRIKNDVNEGKPGYWD